MGNGINNFKCFQHSKLVFRGFGGYFGHFQHFLSILSKNGMIWTNNERLSFFHIFDSKMALVGSYANNINLSRIFGPSAWYFTLPLSFLIFKSHQCRGVEFSIFGQNSQFWAIIHLYLISTPLSYKLRSSCGQLEPKILKIEQL